MSGENKFTIKYWPEEECRHKRFISYGSSTMSNAHLRGILIGSRGQCLKENVVDLNQDLLSAFGTLENLNQASVTKICQIKTIGAAKGAQIKAPLEVEKRMASKPTGVKIKLKSIQVFV
jgi:DNA repair protein RadC